MSAWLIIGMIAAWGCVCFMFVAVSVMAARGDVADARDVRFAEAEGDAPPRGRVAHRGERTAYTPRGGQQVI